MTDLFDFVTNKRDKEAKKNQKKTGEIVMLQLTNEVHSLEIVKSEKAMSW